MHDDKKLIELIFEFIEKKAKRLPNGKMLIEKSPLENKRRMKKMPLKQVNVLKGDVNWFEQKNEDLLRDLSMEYFTAMKESYSGTTGLTNKWVIWKQKPIGGHYKFTYPRNRRRKRVKQFLSLMWKKYQNTLRSSVFFDQYEKLRAMDFQLNKIIQMGDMGMFFTQKIAQCWWG